MGKGFIFEDVVLTEEDITDEMIRQECVAYLLSRIKESNYLRENITVAESERLTSWIEKLDADTAVAVVFSDAKEPWKFSTKAPEWAKSRKAQLRQAAKSAWQKTKGAAAAVKGAPGAAAGKVAKTWKSGKAGKAAVIGGAALTAVAGGLAARAIYKKLTDQCVKQCKGSADKDCVVKCRQAAKAKVAQATA